MPDKPRVILFPLFGGGFIDILHPKVTDIHLTDIARSNAVTPRYLGHSSHPLTIAEHEVRVAVAVMKLYGESFGPEGLLHDASEAYVGEIPRATKHSREMAPFRLIEGNMDQVIRQRFGLPVAMSPCVEAVDRAICRVEIASGLFPHPWDPDVVTDNGSVQLANLISNLFSNRVEVGPFGGTWATSWGWDWKQAEKMFLDMARYLEIT